MMEAFMPLREFKVRVGDDVLARIATRVDAYRWFPAPEGEQWEYGANTEALRDLCRYWRNGYDWRAQEAVLNRYPQFLSEIDGLDVHVVHVRGEGDAAKRPLILTHGWPGSHYEFWEAIPRLAFPSQHGGDAKDAFDVIVPSLPGYAFSGKPKKPLGQRATARLFNTLMTKELGYQRYVAQGGDWGSMVTSLLALDHEACIAAHINMLALRPGGAPQTEEEAAWAQRAAAAFQREGAYFQEQTTKPQTLALALMDSPVGTAAWILEKFHGWSDLRQGGLLSVYSRDQLITNIMLYLVTDSIATSVWYYRARAEEGFSMPAGARLEKPTGVANFAGEPVFQMAPRSYVERAYNVVHWTDFAEGGHFAAMERPDAFVGDVRAFARKIGY
jgi:microsomal epoxide hydrolase